MAFVFSVKDTYRQAVESATGGRNTVMYDDLGYPSVMVAVPKFYLDEVIDGAPRQVHPAFIVNGVEKSEIWISKYQNVIHQDRAYSLPGQDPAVYIDFDTARAACFAKGTGWHLMTNAEWAAIALWCKKNGFMPRGNNNYGRDHSATHERGIETYGGGDPHQTYRTATGSGPATWNHDGTPAGIADLNGNVTEWVDGLKLVNGRIHVHNDNDYDTGNEEGSLDGWVDTERYYDNSVAGDATETDHKVSGNLVLSTSRANPMYTGGDVNSLYGYNTAIFQALTAKDGVSVPDILKHLCLFPVDSSDHGGDYLYARNYGERLARRGGSWVSGSHAGVFYLRLNYPRTYAIFHIGFRAAFVS